jgi:PKD repeat protein
LAFQTFHGDGGVAIGLTEADISKYATDWSWDFGDGGTSELRDPSHTYTKPGHYVVRLTVTGPSGPATEAKPNYICVLPPPPVADFDADPNSGTTPLTVQFTDKSTGGIAKWSWNFGDGVTSGLQNPSHTYESPGKYTVSLTLIGPAGSDTKTVAECIDAAPPPPPQADFVADPNSGEAPLAVQFTDKSSGRISTWLWDFGDGATSDLQNPSHTYERAGDYAVSLTLTGPSGTDTETRTNYIHVEPAVAHVTIDKSGQHLGLLWIRFIASVTVRSRVPDGPPIENAIVEGRWGGHYAGTVTGTTNADGTVTFRTGLLRKSQTTTFTISTVTKDGRDLTLTGERSE